MLSAGDLLCRLALAVQVAALVHAVRQPDGALDSRGGEVLQTGLLAVALVTPGSGLLLAGAHPLAVRPGTDPARRTVPVGGRP